MSQTASEVSPPSAVPIAEDMGARFVREVEWATLRSLVDSADIPAYVVDARHTVRHANGVLLSLLNIGDERLVVGKEFAEMLGHLLRRVPEPLRGETSKHLHHLSAASQHVSLGHFDGHVLVDNRELIGNPSCGLFLVRIHGWTARRGGCDEPLGGVGFLLLTPLDPSHLAPLVEHPEAWADHVSALTHSLAAVRTLAHAGGKTLPQPTPTQLPGRLETDRWGEATEVVKDAFGEVYFLPEAPEIAKRSVLAFRRALLDLMKAYPRRKDGSYWAAFHGDVQVGIGKSQIAAIQLCKARGLPEEECAVHPIEPLQSAEIALDW